MVMNVTSASLAGTSSSSSNDEIKQQQPQQDGTNNNNNDFSFCVLWSPLHPITAVFPFIGHLGISDSRGFAHDFQGPYTVGVDGSRPLPRMAFGRPTRYLKMDIGQLPGGPEQWDEAIIEADRIYKQRIHNICCDNCHSHVARALNIMSYEGRYNWNMVKLCFLVFFKASFVNFSSVLAQFGPFVILLAIILIFT